ncbi:putative oxidoreductase [Globomyces pollinis-pini]|nr:putative oxidoreductase [Globomyces pollinis-pini]
MDIHAVESELNSTEKVIKRQLGKNGPFVSPIGLGTMGMSFLYTSNETDELEHLDVLNYALDIGCTFWDTSDVYGPFTNEMLLAKVLSKRRQEVFICTKFGLTINDAVTESNPGYFNICGTPEYVKQCCDESLKRLGIDCIDLYYCHRPDPNVPIEDTVGAMAELVEEGKVKYLGLSVCSPDQIRRAYKIHPIHAYQVEFNPWHRNILTDGTLDVCRELGIAIIPYGPLGRGFLTGQIKSLDDLATDDWRRNNPKFKKSEFEKNLRIVNKFEELAMQKNLPASQLCLAWVLSHGDDFIPIPGTKRQKYLMENWNAHKVKLTQEEIHHIDRVIQE